jgi:hypothetical protein
MQRGSLTGIVMAVYYPGSMSATTLTIRRARLPDLDREAPMRAAGYEAYGRFALLRGGGFWFGELRSSHPGTTTVGWYWAIDARGELLVSPRGAAVDGELLFGERRDLLARLVAELVGRRLLPKPGSIRLA